MRRWVTALFVASTVVAKAEEPPLPEPEVGLEIDPPILIQSRDSRGMPVVPTPTPPADFAKLERDLTRAKKNAGSADRLFRAGIISKVEAEERVLKVIRLEAKLAEARLSEAKRQDEERGAADETGGAATAQSVAEAEAEAKRTSEERRRAEIEAAFRNLQRQQKLLALGSGRKADVSRAEQKLAELQQASE